MTAGGSCDRMSFRNEGAMLIGSLHCGLCTRANDGIEHSTLKAVRSSRGIVHFTCSTQHCYRALEIAAFRNLLVQNVSEN